MVPGMVLLQGSQASGQTRAGLSNFHSTHSAFQPTGKAHLGGKLDAVAWLATAGAVTGDVVSHAMTASRHGRVISTIPLKLSWYKTAAIDSSLLAANAALGLTRGTW